MARKAIIELLEQNELDISTLYGIYARDFPDHADFWSKLSQEEAEHAGIISTTHKKSDLKRFFVPNDLARDVIRYVHNYIKECILEARKRKRLTHADAVSAALRIERSTVENKCLEILVPSSRAAKDMVRGLNKETKKHIRILMKELGKIAAAPNIRKKASISLRPKGLA